MNVRIALAQINPTVGNLEGNCKIIVEGIEKARSMAADLVVFPELALTGYPPEDLLLKPYFLDATQAMLQETAQASRDIIAIVGLPLLEKDLYNSAAICQDGEVRGFYRKRYLPNYGVFDEDRYFREAQDRIVFGWGEHRFGVSICEDIWYPDGPPCEQAIFGDAELLINISSSPYHRGKGKARERMLSTRASDSVAYVAYCNLVGGQDELVFDGQSAIFGPEGSTVARARQFEEDFLVADINLDEVLRLRLCDPRRRKARGEKNLSFHVITLDKRYVPPEQPTNPGRLEQPLEPVEEVYKALVVGTRDYVRKNRFGKVVLGLSGGIDSALTATIAVAALGPENVVGVAMPTRYSSSHSLEDAENLAKNLGIQFMVFPIDNVFQSFLDLLNPTFENRPPDTTEENIQPRVRGTLLMALSNKFDWLVLTTGNKSEVAVGYCTLYGDTAGGFAVIKDIPKLLVYALSRYVNASAGREIIPFRTIEKPPSAELRPDQQDTDSLPPYDILDPILEAYVEKNLSPKEVEAYGYDPSTVKRIIKLVECNEYKRRQSPPGPKITTRVFGKDRRMPVSNQFDPTKSR